MNGLISLREIYRIYSIAPADDLIRFWMSKVKVTAGHRGGEASSLGIKVHLDVVMSLIVLIVTDSWYFKRFFVEDKCI